MHSSQNWKFVYFPNSSLLHYKVSQSCCLSWFLQTPLHLAAQQGDVSEVKTLADTGADTNAKDKNGASETILMVVD